VWAVGFFGTVAAIKMIGIGLATLFWSISCMFIGWATSRFGLFGAEASIPNTKTKDIFNYIGISLCLVSVVQSSFIKIEEINNFDDQNSERSLLINNHDSNAPLMIGSIRINNKSKRLIGSIVALLVGISAAFSYTPILYIQKHDKEASNSMNAYAFSIYTGILITAILVFVIYSIFSKNKPEIHPQTVLPGIISG
jgi:uncharacterized membrane protein YdcZ (DUF606 family)